MAWCVTVPSYVMKRLKSSLAAARSGDAKARFIASSLSNSSAPSAPPCPGLPETGLSSRPACGSPCAASRATRSRPARGPSCSARESPSGRPPRCHSARNRKCSRGLRLVQQELQHRHRAVAARDQVARQRTQLAKAPGIQALEQHVVDSHLEGGQALEQLPAFF